jgi:hypothetical protein
MGRFENLLFALVLVCVLALVLLLVAGLLGSAR